MDGSLVPLDLPALDGEPRAHAAAYRIHSAILSAARYLLSPSSSSPLYSNLLRILADHPRYGLVFTGHSLGAALASTLALLVGTYDPLARQWFVEPSAPLGNGETRRPVRAVCFAHPTTLNVPLAERCAVPKQALRPEPASAPNSNSTSTSSDRGVPLVINVSLGADVICRMGVPQVRELRRTLGRLDRLRAAMPTTSPRGGGGPDTDTDADTDTAAVGIIGGWRRWRQVVTRRRADAESDSELDGLDQARRSRSRRRRDELELRAWQWRREAEGWDRDREGALPEEADIEVAIPAGHCFHLDALPPPIEAHKRREARIGRGKVDAAADEPEDEDEDAPVLGLYEVRDPTRFYAMPILSADLLGAHMPKAYLEATQAL